MATKAEMMAEAYRRGLLPPDRAALYEEAARRGLVHDGYASGRAEARSNPVSGGVATFLRSIPGASELGAAVPAGIAAVQDAIAGRHGPNDGFGADFNAIRARQQGNVDQFQADHPALSSLTTGVGLAAPAAAALLTGGAAAPALAARSAAGGGLRATAGRLATAAGRNAITGAAIGAGYGASAPGTLQERLAGADRGIIPGAVGGVAIPAAIGAAQAGGRAVGAVGGRVGAVGSEMLDSASRALTGKTVSDQARPIPPAVAAQGRQAALDYLARQGVTPEALEAAQTQAGGKPITTAEAGGPALISQAAGLARRAGATPAVADAAMQARGADRGARILGDLHEITGVHPEAAKGNIDAIVQNGQQAAAPLYDAALGEPTPVWSSRLEELAQRPQTAKAVKTAISQMLSEGRDPHALGLTFMEDPSSAGGIAPPLPGEPTEAELAAVKAPRGPARAPSRGLSMAQYIAKNGGISDAGGEIANMGGDTWHVGKPFQPRLIGNGDTADGWGRRLQDAGYFPSWEDPGEHEVLDALNREIKGSPTYAREADQAAQDRFLNRSTADERAHYEANYAGPDTPSPEQYQGGTEPVAEPVQMAQPTAETWDLVKKALGRSVERNPITGAPMPDSISPGNHAVNTELKALTQALRDHIPGYGEALDTAGDYLSVKGAYDRGQGTLFSPSRDPRDFDAYFQNLSPAEQHATRASLANDIYSAVNNGRLRPGAFSPPAVQQKLATAFGQDKAQAIVDRMATEAKMSAAAARMTPNLNSVTGDVIGSDADRGDLGTALRLGGAMGNAITGRPVAAIKGVAGAMLPFVSAARAPLGMATRDALGSMLYQDPAATAEAMRQSMNAINVTPTAIPRSVVSLSVVPQIAYDQDQQPAQ